MLSRIGVVIQTRDEAAVGLRRCLDIARRIGASVHVIDVTEPAPRWLSRASAKRVSEEELVQERRALVEHFVSNVRSGGVPVSVAVRRGQRIVELLAEVRDRSVDLIALVIDDALQSPTTAEAFANRVVRKSPVPVLVLRPEKPWSSGAVVALDISVADESRDLINAITQHAVEIAAVGSRITLVYVLEVPDGAEADGLEIDQVVRSTMSERHRRMEEFAARLGSAATVAVDVRVGRPVDEIAAVVHERQPELLVIGTLSRSGPGLMIGNTAEALLREVACSVLAVKPPGFRSPVT